MAFSSKHNKYVSTPDWFGNTSSSSTSPTVSKIVSTIISSGSQAEAAPSTQSSVILYNKFVLEYKDATIDILTLNNTAIVAVAIEGDIPENTIPIGKLVSIIGWKTSDFINIAANTILTVTATIHSNYGIVFYDNTQLPISGAVISQEAQQVAVPENAFYFRICSTTTSTFNLNYASPLSYDNEQLQISNLNVSDYLQLNNNIPEGINTTSFDLTNLQLLVQNPLHITKDKNNVIKLSLDKSYIETGGDLYVTVDETEQDIQGVKTFIKGIKIGNNKLSQLQEDVIYLDGNLVVKGGVTMYADDGNVDVPSLYEGIPIDGETLFWEEDAEGNKVLKANSGTIKKIETDGKGNAITSVTLGDDNSTLLFHKNGEFAYQSQVDIISDNLDDLDTEFHEFKDYAETYYVTVHTEQEIYGKKDFTTGGLFVNGNQIIYNKDDDYWMLRGDLLITGGITTYVNDGTAAPSLFEALPIDQQTIIRNEAGALMINPDLEFGLNEEELISFLEANKYATQSWVYSLKYASASALTNLSDKVNDFLEGSDTDVIINKWKELETFLSGLSETDNLATILGNKADKATTLAGYGITDAYTKSAVDTLLGDYVTLKTAQTITGEKNFTGGLKVNGSPIVYDATNKYWKLEGDLLVTGGVTMYATDAIDIPSIIDSIPVASTSAKGLASFDPDFFSVDANGKVTFIGQTGGITDLPIATTSVKGIASFDSNFFTVSSGKVSFNGGKIKVVTSAPSSYDANTLYVITG